MKHGFIKVAAATVDIKVSDTAYNAEKIIEKAEELSAQGVKLAVFPELCLTGYTCSDLFLQDVLLEGALEGLVRLVKVSAKWDMLVLVGLPFARNGRLYNIAAVIKGGRLLGIIPKTSIPGYSEFYESRHFASGNLTGGSGSSRITGEQECEYLDIKGLDYPVPFGTKLLFRATNMEEFVLGVEICEDLWMPIPPSSLHAEASATVIANLSASDEVTGKDGYRRELVRSQSGRLLCGYIYADAGEGESSTDLVFAAHNMIAENGTMLAETERFQNDTAVSELDMKKLVNERRRITTFPIRVPEQEGYEVIEFAWEHVENTVLSRTFAQTPFVPSVKEDRDKRCEEILNIQAMGLKKRLQHTNCKNAVIGISGGLDSTLALLVTLKAFDMLGLSHEGIHGITMPCFGTTDRTYQNALTLIEKLGATLHEIPIHEAVNLHLRDIGHDSAVHDITYENAQARERTQVLMNVANQLGGMVIGTGDMSELALGWATYNGDHMSMYGVNASVPKTLVRYLVLYYADTTPDEKLREALLDVLDTPVSPELLPPEDGKIAQKTEDIVGPYELHDFYLYYMMRFGFRPSKIYRLAREAFSDKYQPDVICKWLQTFYRRFFSQQFKRSCLPDGPKVGSVAVSPRGDLRMPSDAAVTIWMQDLESIKPE